MRVVPNPVEILGRARNRIALVAAIRAGAYALAPVFAAIVLSFALGVIGRVTWMRWGYILAPERAALLRDMLYALAAGSIATGAALAFRAYRRAMDFVAAAEQVDNAVHARQQILTLAALADPARADAVKAARSPLFPLLWRHAIGLLERFDPAQAFPLDLGRPLLRSSIIAGALAAVMLIAAMGLVRPPTPEQAMAERLRKIAREIESSSSDPTDRSIAGAAIAAADALENSKIPPPEKIKKIDQAMRDLEQKKKQTSGSEKGAGTGAGSQAAKGKGSEASQGGKEGKGTGPGGSGKSNQAGSGAGKNQQGKNNGSNNGQGKQGKDKSAQLQQELTEARNQVESDASKNQKPEANKPGNDKRPGNAPKQGGTPDKKAAATKPDATRPGNVPKQGEAVQQNVPPTAGSQPSKNDMGSNLGDTHLGEMPPAANFQRYLKPGEKGASLDIQNARYVMFRLPNATPVGAGGKTVIDTNRPTAATAYVNAPLKQTKDTSTPDERQFVPPRYRDLIQ